MAAYSTEHRGQGNSLGSRIYFRDATGKPISPFHDIPMFADEGNKLYNMVVEVPRWSNAKMEIATKEPLNPIKQDVKGAKLRFVKNCFPHHGYIWNYGAIPQTWENPNHLDEATGHKGDNDPIDICEIGSKVHERGAVVKVKILGVIALVDEGETDWKLIAIDIDDALAAQLNDIEDVEMMMPGLLKASVEWFKIYKMPDGKPPNKFAFNEEPKNREFAENIIAETNKYWKELISSPPDAGVNTTGLDLKNVNVTGSPYTVTDSEALLAAAPPAGPAVPLSEAEQVAIDKWYYVTLA